MKPSINPYLRTKVLTANPQELRLMLYDGCLKFMRSAHQAIGRGDFETSFESVQRAQKIVLELSTSLKHDMAPELCGKLSALYTYVYRLLVEASTTRQAESLDKAIKIIEFERETWTMLMTQTLESSGNEGDAPTAASAQLRQSAFGAFAQSA